MVKRMDNSELNLAVETSLADAERRAKILQPDLTEDDPMYIFEDGLYSLLTHGIEDIIKMIDNYPHIMSKKKTQDYWCPTVIELSRLKKATQLTEFDIVRKMK